MRQSLIVALTFFATYHLSLAQDSESAATGRKTGSSVVPAVKTEADPDSSNSEGRDDGSSPGIQIPHPEEILSQLQLLSRQFTAAGLPEEARAMRMVEDRIRDVHLRQLADAHARSQERQISVKVQLCEIHESPEAIELLNKLYNNDQTGNTLPTNSARSMVLSRDEAPKWIEEMKKTGYLKIALETQLTVLNGRLARIQNTREDVAAPSGKIAHTNLEPRFHGPKLLTKATIVDKKMIHLELTASMDSNAGKVNQIRCDVDVLDGQTLALSGLQSTGTSVEVTRVPVLGDIPVAGPKLFSSKKMVTNTNDLLYLITPEILLPSQGAPPVKGLSIQPAGHAKPAK